MGTLAKRTILSLAVMAAGICGANADDRGDYDRRSSERYQQLFQSLDRNADQAVTLEESFGDLNFSPVFNDMDINRDGVVTANELNRYVGQNYGSR